MSPLVRLTGLAAAALVSALAAVPPPKDRFPFVETFQKHGRTLIYVAATHHWPGLFPQAMADPLFRTIQQIFTATPPDAAIIEGVDPDSSMVRYIDHARRCAAAGYDLPNQVCGEPALTAYLAAERKIPVLTGEPSTRDSLRFMESHGYSAQDLFALYVARQITTRNHGRHIGQDEFASLLAGTVAYYAHLAGTPLSFTVADFEAWYAKNMRTPASYLDLTSDDLYPAPQAGPPTSALHRISGTLETLRDQTVVSQITSALGRHHLVLVVYGGSHLQFEWSDLVELLGVPKKSESVRHSEQQ